MNASLLTFAKYYGVKTVGALAQKAKVHWPPPPPVSVRSFLPTLGAPEQPITQALSSKGLDYTLTWKDPAAGTPRAATSWPWVIQDNADAKTVFQGTASTPTASQTVVSGKTYNWWVGAKNDYGQTSPTELIQFDTVKPPPPSPTITATISASDVVTITGKNFNVSKPVVLQVTVTGATLANGAQDDRTIQPDLQKTANGSGGFTLTLSPQQFGQAEFSQGAIAYILQGETIAVIAANGDVNSFSPGPGVSNVLRVTAPTTV